MSLGDSYVMKLKTISASIMLALSTTLPTLASASWLSPADDYNLFLSGDLTSNSDTQGRIAAGGNITLNNYSVGLLSASSDYSLVAGGNVNFQSGSIHNGGTYSSGNTHLNHHSVAGNVTSQGNVSFGSGGGSVSGSISSNSLAASPANFASSFSYLNNASNTLGGMANTGAVFVNSGAGYANITLTGSSALNVFSIDSALLASATSLTFDVGNNAALINVTGSSVSMGGFGINNGGNDGSNILYNFYEADSLSIENLGLFGSILAPDAELTFDSGQINGTVVAQSMYGSGQFNYNPFGYGDPFSPQTPLPTAPVPVSEPQTLLLLGSGSLLLLGLNRRRKKNKV